MINNYKDLTIKKFVELRNIDTEGVEEIDVQVQMLSILSDMDEDAILSLPLEEYKKMVRESAFLLKEPQTRGKCPKKVIINGKEYTVLDDVRKMTAGQYIDYQNYLGRGETDKNLPYLLSCFIIPKGEKYGDSDVIEEMDNLPIETALTIANFFFGSRND